MRRTSFYLPIWLGLLLVGCNSEPEPVAVSGAVLLDGKAIGNCILVLQSLETDGSPAGATAVVSEGKFAIPKSSGLFPGEYSAVLTELQPDLEDYELARRGGSKKALNKKFIPHRYTRANELRVKIAADAQPISLELNSRSR